MSEKSAAPASLIPRGVAGMEADKMSSDISLEEAIRLVQETFDVGQTASSWRRTCGAWEVIKDELRKHV